MCNVYERIKLTHETCITVVFSLYGNSYFTYTRRRAQTRTTGDVMVIIETKIGKQTSGILIMNSSCNFVNLKQIQQ